MTATKIFIDPNEDLVFTVHKINTADSQKVILVLPVGANISSSQVSLKLLSRMLARTDKLVVLVSDDTLTRKYAQRAHLKVVPKVSEVSTEVWDEVNSLKQELIITKDKKKMELLAERTEASVEAELAHDEKPKVQSDPKLGQRPEKKTPEVETSPALITPPPVAMPTSASPSAPETSLVVAEPDVEPDAEPDVEPTISLDLNEPEAKSPEVEPGQGSEVIVPTEKPGEVKPLFNKLEPKIVELNNFALLSGGDVSQSALAPILKNKLKFVTRQLESLESQPPQPQQSGAHTVAQMRAHAQQRGNRSASSMPEPEDLDNMDLPRHSVESSETTAETSLDQGPSRIELAQAKFAEVTAAAKLWSTNAKSKLAANFQLLKSKLASRQSAARPASSGYIPTPRTSEGRGVSLGRNYARTNFPNSRNVPSRLSRGGAISSMQTGSSGGSSLETLRDNLGVYLQRFGSNRGRTGAAIAGVIVLILLLSIFVFSTADVIITVESRGLPISQLVKASKDSVFNAQTATLPLHSVSKPGSNSTTAPATGKGQKGEKASVLLSILNSSNKAFTINAGTVLSLVGKNNLDFVTGSAVTVPSAESAKNVRVTATAIGEQYNQLNNLKKEFVVKGKPNPEVSIFTYDQIAGGTKQEIVVVSDADVKGAKESVISNLKETITSEVNALISESEIALTGQLKFSEPQVNVSKKVGDETETFDVGVTMSGEMLVVSREDLSQIAQAVASKNADAAGEFSIKEIETPVVSAVKEDKGIVTFTLTSAAKLSADISTSDVKKQIVGTNPDAAKEKLLQLQDVKDVKLSYSPQFLPGFLRRIPSDEGKITVKIIK